MKFQEAKDKLRALAAGSYSGLRYNETFPREGECTVECEVIVFVGQNLFSSFRGGHANTWEQAFDDLAFNMGKVTPKDDQSPGESDDDLLGCYNTYDAQEGAQ